jgi:cytochrome b
MRLPQASRRGGCLLNCPPATIFALQRNPRGLTALPNHRPTLVWDFPTRLFHWSLVILVGTNLFLIGPGGGLRTVVHFVAGFLIAGLLLFRLAWGFIGSSHSRFADFLRPWPALTAYVKRLCALKPPRSIGHNPLGGLFIVVLLLALATMVGTGLFAASRHAAGPFAHLVSTAVSAKIGGIHVLVSNLLIGLIVVHLLGVAVDWLLTGENLVKAMIDGRKELPAETAGNERPVAPLWRAALVGLVSLAIVGGLAANTDFKATRATLQAAQAQSSPPAPGSSN